MSNHKKESKDIYLRDEYLINCADGQKTVKQLKALIAPYVWLKEIYIEGQKFPTVFCEKDSQGRTRLAIMRDALSANQYLQMEILMNTIFKNYSDIKRHFPDKHVFYPDRSTDYEILNYFKYLEFFDDAHELKQKIKEKYGLVDILSIAGSLLGMLFLGASVMFILVGLLKGVLGSFIITSLATVAGIVGISLFALAYGADYRHKHILGSAKNLAYTLVVIGILAAFSSYMGLLALPISFLPIPLLGFTLAVMFWSWATLILSWDMPIFPDTQSTHLSLAQLNITEQTHTTGIAIKSIQDQYISERDIPKLLQLLKSKNNISTLNINVNFEVYSMEALKSKTSQLANEIIDLTLKQPLLQKVELNIVWRDNDEIVLKLDKDKLYINDMYFSDDQKEALKNRAATLQKHIQKNETRPLLYAFLQPSAKSYDEKTPEVMNTPVKDAFYGNSLFDKNTVRIIKDFLEYQPLDATKEGKGKDSKKEDDDSKIFNTLSA